MSQPARSPKSPNLWQRLRTPQLAPPWSMADAISTLLALGLALFMLASGLTLVLFGETLSTFSLLVGWSAGLLMMIAFVSITRRRTPEERAAMRLGLPRAPLSIYLLLGLAVALTLDLVAAGGAGAFLAVPALRGLEDLLPAWILALIFLGLLQPVAESLIFWAVLMPRLRASLSPLSGYVISVALYAALHLLVYGARLSGPDSLWYGLIVPLGMGAFLGGVRITSQSSLATIVAAIGSGLTAFAVAVVIGT